MPALSGFSKEKQTRIIDSLFVLEKSVELMKLKYSPYFDSFLKAEIKRIEKSIKQLNKELSE